jgi:hypothetical protein
MKEKYLHYLWKNKLLPLHQMVLTNGDSFQILYPGDYNEYESGPDFLNAQLKINELIWHGHVEIHLKSNDWYKHDHQNDRAYDTVILHVVHDFNGDVFIQDKAIPTLELKGKISHKHYINYQQFFKNKRTILCASQVHSVPDIHLTQLKERAIYQRLSAKTMGICSAIQSTDPKQVLYYLLARAFGTKINQLPFEELAQRLPLSILKKVDKKLQLELLLDTSGLSNRHSLFANSANDMRMNVNRRGRVDKSAWKFGGTRPQNSPRDRIYQFARIVEQFDFEVAFVFLAKEEFLNHCYTLLSKSWPNEKGYTPNRLTQNFKNAILINCFVPFLFWYGQLVENAELVDKALDLLRILPAEENGIVQKWNLCAVEANNAADSQALLEIFNQFCSKKKCLTCSIGTFLLNQ